MTNKEIYIKAVTEITALGIINGSEWAAKNLPWTIQAIEAFYGLAHFIGELDDVAVFMCDPEENTSCAKSACFKNEANHTGITCHYTSSFESAELVHKEVAEDD